jgi:RNA recognition motif-containing protein
MKLIVRNLDRATKEKELKPLFEKFGKVQYCNIITDKETSESKGFAFVEMPKIGDAKAAMKNLNGKEVGENKIRVKKAEVEAENKKKKDFGNSKQK